MTHRVKCLASLLHFYVVEKVSQNFVPQTPCCAYNYKKDSLPIMANISFFDLLLISLHSSDNLNARACPIICIGFRGFFCLFTLSVQKNQLIPYRDIYDEIFISFTYFYFFFKINKSRGWEHFNFMRGVAGNASREMSFMSLPQLFLSRKLECVAFSVCSKQLVIES